VDSVLAQAEEHYMRQCALRRRGYDLQKVAERVAEIYGIKVGGFLGKGRQQHRVGARSLFCFWAVRDLGNSLASLAKRLEMSPAGLAMRYKEERSLLRRTVMSLYREILNYLRASPFILLSKTEGDRISFARSDESLIIASGMIPQGREVNSELEGR